MSYNWSYSNTYLSESGTVFSLMLNKNINEKHVEAFRKCHSCKWYRYMQNCVDKFSVACDNFGLTSSTKKDRSDAPASAWKTIHQAQSHHRGAMTEGGKKFTYLSSILTKSIIMNDMVNNRLTKVSAAFDRLNSNVWNQRGILETTKIKVYWAVVLSPSFMAVKRGLLINKIQSS